MEKIIKIIVSGLLSLGGVGATVATVQEAKSNNPVEITVVPDSPETTQGNSQTTVTVEQAKAAALKEMSGTIISQSEDDDDYEFKIQKDGYIYDIDVDKKTGKIDGVDKEKVTVANITLEQAKATALKEVNGTIISQSEDDDDYEFKIQKDGYIYDIDVNKMTGKIDDIDKEKVKTTNASSTKVTLEQAKATALKKVNGTIISQSEDDDDYEFKIQKDGYIYDIDVDKKTGKIDDIDKEKVKTVTSKITFEEAKKLALAKVNGKIVSSETDDDEYKFEISKDNYLYEIEVSRKTGKITDIEKEIIQSKTSVISYEQAKSIALKQVNGTIHSIDYDDDDHEYSVEIINGHVEYEVEIDALTGKVIKVEKDD